MSATELTKITPNCRYGHGDLLQVADDEASLWVIPSGENRQTGFMGNLFVCTQCGYTELFDDAPLETLKMYGKQ